MASAWNNAVGFEQMTIKTFLEASSNFKRWAATNLFADVGDLNRQYYHRAFTMPKFSYLIVEQTVQQAQCLALDEVEYTILLKKRQRYKANRRRKFAKSIQCGGKLLRNSTYTLSRNFV